MHSRELTISEMMDESNLILEVEFIKNFKEEIAISNRNADSSSSETIPPFLKKGCVFKVRSVLKNSAGIEVPPEIKVPVENWHRALSKHKKEYLGGPGRSYTITEYKSGIATMAKASVLFLQHFQGTYELTAKDAFEGKPAVEKISILLGNSR